MNEKTNTEQAIAQELEHLSELRCKAETTRFAHSQEMRGARFWRRGIQVVSAMLSLVLAGLSILARDDKFPDWGYWMMAGMAIIPPLMLFVHNISGIFRWSSREEDHEVAVHIWGAWIRKCDATEASTGVADSPLSVVKEECAKIRHEYSECMEKTPLIPTSRFLRHKRNFRKYKQKSKDIDKEFGCQKGDDKTD